MLVAVLKLLHALIEYTEFDARGIYEALLPSVIQLVTGTAAPRPFFQRESILLQKIGLSSRLNACIVLLSFVPIVRYQLVEYSRSIVSFCEILEKASTSEAQQL